MMLLEAPTIGRDRIVWVRTIAAIRRVGEPLAVTAIGVGIVRSQTISTPDARSSLGWPISTRQACSRRPDQLTARRHRRRPARLRRHHRHRPRPRRPGQPLRPDRRRGVAFCRSVYGTTPRGGVVDIEGGLSAGLPDVLAFPDLSTLQPIPWEPGVAHCIADLFNPDGSLSAESPRNVLSRWSRSSPSSAWRPIVGPELEFYMLERVARRRPRAGSGTARARATSTSPGSRATPRTCCSATLRQLGDYGIEVVAANHEFSSGQFEINLWHGEALDAADRAHRFKHRGPGAGPPRRATSRRSCPSRSTTRAAPDYHLHFSIWSDGRVDPALRRPGRRERAVRRGAPRGRPASSATRRRWRRCQPDDQLLQAVRARHPGALADRLGHGQPQRDGADPTRARLAPPAWSCGSGDASANSYLAIAGMLAAALLGIRDKTEPPEPLVGYGYDVSPPAKLPQTLGEALDAFEADTEFADVLGEPFVKTFLSLTSATRSSASTPGSPTGSSTSTPTTSDRPSPSSRSPRRNRDPPRARPARRGRPRPTSTASPTCAASRSSTPCAPRIPVHWNPEAGAQPRVLGGHALRRHLDRRPATRDLHLRAVRQPRGVSTTSSWTIRRSMLETDGARHAGHAQADPARVHARATC